MLGQFALFDKAWESHSFQRVVLIMHPYSLLDNLNTSFTANYVVGPFYRKGYKHYFSNYAVEQMKATPWYWVPVVFRKFPEYCRLNYQEINPRPFQNEQYLSPLSVEYLVLMAEFCKREGVEFVVLSPPLPSRLTNSDFSFMREQVATAGLEKEFATYFDLDFYPEGYFVDEIHLYPVRVEELRSKMDAAVFPSSQPIQRSSGVPRSAL